MSLVTAHLAWPGGENLVPMGGETLFKRPLLMPACRGRIPIGDVDSVLSIHVLVTSRLDRTETAERRSRTMTGTSMAAIFLACFCRISPSRVPDVPRSLPVPPSVHLHTAEDDNHRGDQVPSQRANLGLGQIHRISLPYWNMHKTW